MATRRQRKRKQDRARKDRKANQQMRTLKTEDKSPQGFNYPSTEPYPGQFTSLPRPCSFNDLPGELRNHIYSLALQQDDILPSYANLPPTFWRDERIDDPCALSLASSPPPAAQALSHVSRLVRAESMAMYYGRQTFTFRNFSLARVEWLRSWVQSWGVLATSNIRSLELHCEGWREKQFVKIDLDNRTQPAECFWYTYDFWYQFPFTADVNQLILLLARKHSDGTIGLSPARLVALLKGLVPFQKLSEKRATAVGIAGRSMLQKKQLIAKLLK